jgi:protein TonB
MNGRDKCDILKQIRRDIADKNGIMLKISECTHKGDCVGTCPSCESEIAALEKALENRKKQGKKIILAGISAGIVAASCASCEPYVQVKEFGQKLLGIESLQGDIAIESTDLEAISNTEEATDSPEIMGKVAPSEDEYEIEGDINPDFFDTIETEVKDGKNE